MPVQFVFSLFLIIFILEISNIIALIRINTVQHCNHFAGNTVRFRSKISLIDSVLFGLHLDLSN